MTGIKLGMTGGKARNDMITSQFSILNSQFQTEVFFGAYYRRRLFKAGSEPIFAGSHGDKAGKTNS